MVKKRILLGVDAALHPGILEFFSNAEKFSVSVISDGDEALRCLSEKWPDMALLDVNLPGKGGDACCGDAKRAGLATPIVLLAPAANGEGIARCRNAGCDALLTTPLGQDRLSAVVREILFGERGAPPRVEVRLPVRYGLQPRDLRHNYSVNLSVGGIFIEAPRVLPVDTPLVVAFTLPDDGTAIDCTARVSWQNGPVLRRQPLLPTGMGLEFLDLSQQKADAIRKFLTATEGLHHA
ncbi:MAG TPA: PilZ domain-containing protein [Geobacteraceae bacterium]